MLLEWHCDNVLKKVPVPRPRTLSSESVSAKSQASNGTGAVNLDCLQAKHVLR